MAGEIKVLRRRAHRTHDYLRQRARVPRQAGRQARCAEPVLRVACVARVPSTWRLIAATVSSQLNARRCHDAARLHVMGRRRRESFGPFVSENRASARRERPVQLVRLPPLPLFSAGVLARCRTCSKRRSKLAGCVGGFRAVGDGHLMTAPTSPPRHRPRPSAVSRGARRRPRVITSARARRRRSERPVVTSWCSCSAAARTWALASRAGGSA